MELHDEHIPADRFESYIADLPQVCVELVVQTTDGILVTKRTTKPRCWFWPGGRLYKGESLEAAVHRIAGEELGIEVEIQEQLGVHAHFWPPEQTEHETSRHTVNIVYLVEPTSRPVEIELDDQHEDYRYLSQPEPDLHEYIQEYLETHELLV